MKCHSFGFFIAAQTLLNAVSTEFFKVQKVAQNAQTHSLSNTEVDTKSSA
jgi:hypothetical protein